MRRVNQRGHFLLLWGFSLAVLFLNFILGYFPFFQTTLRLSGRGFFEAQALSLAEAGAEQALWEFKFGGADFIGWTNISTQPACAALGGTDCRQLLLSDMTAGDLYGGNLGDITVTVVNPTGLAPLIVATGFVPDQTAPASSQTVHIVIAKPQGETFRYAAFGGNSVKLLFDGAGGTTIDSYDSTQGAYGALLPGLTTNITSRGHIGTNDAPPDVDVDLLIETNTSVDGIGYLTSSAQALVNGTLSGGLVNQPAQSLPPFTTPSTLTSLTSAGVLTLSSGTVTLTGNNRYSRINVSSNARLVLTPGAKLYIDGAGDLIAIDLFVRGVIEAQGGNQIFLDGTFELGDTGGTGGIINTSSSTNPRPKELQIYRKDTENPTRVSLIKQSSFSGVIYSQDGSMSVTSYDASNNWNMELFGSLIAKQGVSFSYKAGRTIKFHYDESLNGLLIDGSGSSVNLYTVQSWQPQ